MTDYRLVPDQSQLDVFHDLHDVIGKEELGTDFPRNQNVNNNGVQRGVYVTGCLGKSLNKERKKRL